MSEQSRPYEVVVFGATGFTGGMTAEYLARNAPPDLRWAIAGRSPQKLDALQQKLLALAGDGRTIDTLQASVDDPASLARVAGQTRVLLTTVGPFIDYGEPVVRACVEQGTDYIDSTGEPAFVQQVIERYGAQAQQRGVRLVSSCGLDSIPTDLGVLFTLLQLPAGQPLKIAGYLKLHASFSGGTERSAIKVLGSGRPQLATETPSAGRRVQLLPGKVERLPELGWVAPLPTIDGPMVLRSAAALDRYGPNFAYAHHAVHGSLAVVLIVGFVFALLAIAARVPPLRALMLAAAKKPGQGPTPEQMAKHWFKLRFIAECAGKSLQTEVAGGDPGYGETSKMLAESALCLARDRARLPASFGALTPAQAMGELLLERLQRAGLSFRVIG